MLLDKDGYAVIVDLGFGMYFSLEQYRMLISIPTDVMYSLPLYHSQKCDGQDLHFLRHSSLSGSGDCP